MNKNANRKTSNKIRNYKQGFAAIILVISISALLLAFSFMQSIEYGHFFDEVINKENRLTAYYSALSCIDQAVLAISHDFFFTTTNIVDIPELNCSIYSVLDDDNKKIIKVYGKYRKAVVYMNAVIRLFDDHLEIVSIE